MHRIAHYFFYVLYFSQRVCNISQIFQGDFADCQRQQFVWSYCLSIHHPPAPLLFSPPSASWLEVSYSPNLRKLVCARSSAVGKVSGYNLHYQINNVRHFSLQKCNIADASFSSWKKWWGEQRTLSTLGRQLVKGRLCSNKRQIQQCNGDLWQRAKQLQDSRTFVTMRKNTPIYIDFMRAASLFIMMFSASIDWCKNKNWIRRHEKPTPNKKWNIPDARYLSLPAKQCKFLQNYQ